MNRWTRPTSKTNFKHLKELLHIKQELSVESFLSSSTNTSSHHHLTCPPPTHSRSSEKGNLFNWSHAGYISKRSVLLHKRFLGLSSHHCYNQRLPGCEPRSLISKNILCWSVISLCSTLTSLLSTLKKKKHEEKGWSEYWTDRSRCPRLSPQAREEPLWWPTAPEIKLVAVLVE